MSYRFSRVSFLRAVLIFVVVLLSSLQKERQFVTADVRLRHGEHIKVLARVENPDLKYVRVDDIDEKYLNETMKRDDDDGEYARGGDHRRGVWRRGRARCGGGAAGVEDGPHRGEQSRVRGARSSVIARRAHVL